MKILITGSEGFIGKNFKEYFRGQGHEVVGFDKKVYANEDCLNFAHLRENAQYVNVVVHLAAEPGIQTSVDNPLVSRDDFLMTFNVLELARLDHKHVVLASSVAAKHPTSPYAASKMALEAFAMAYMNSYECDISTLIIPNVYGIYSNEKNTVVHRLMRQEILGLPHTVFEGGRQTRDFIYVGKLAAVALKAIESGSIFIDGANHAEPETINRMSEIISNNEFSQELSTTYNWIEATREEWEDKAELYS